MSDVHERLRRLLFLVPYVAKHPGISVDSLAQALGLPKEALLEDLDLLTMVGRPPFQPDDYIDLHVENDRVYVDLDQRLSAPPRLTAPEAAALAAAAELLKPPSGGALASALQKLERVLLGNARCRYKEMGTKIDAASGAPAELAPLSEAIAARKEVEFDYFAQGRGQTERRAVRPYELFSHRGYWYLSAFCLSRGDKRLFRLDRIQNLSLTDRAFEPEPAPVGSLMSPVSARGEVRVRFSSQAAPYLKERFGDQAKVVGGGEVEVQVLGESERWLTQWVLSFGGEAVVVEPEWAREAVARAAEASLKS